MDRKIIAGIILGAVTFVVVTFLALQALAWMGYAANTKMPGHNFVNAIAIFIGVIGASFAYTLINGHKNPPKEEDKMDVMDMMKKMGKKL
ncbi:MAG: hypothetical protein K8E24_010960 [Methanobacterium paludis]|nr:hypothetical protein [Methanobacterium paludis]